jgi:hypothetical protein
VFNMCVLFVSDPELRCDGGTVSDLKAKAGPCNYFHPCAIHFQVQMPPRVPRSVGDLNGGYISLMHYTSLSLSCSGIFACSGVGLLWDFNLLLHSIKLLAPKMVHTHTLSRTQRRNICSSKAKGNTICAFSDAVECQSKVMCALSSGSRNILRNSS